MRFKTTLASALLLATPSAVLAGPVVDQWSCGARLTLEELARSTTREGVEKLEKCADAYLTWALESAKEHPPLIEAIKTRHAAFVAYVRGRAGVGGVDLRALKTKLGEADARVEVEAKASGL